jgi:hypothetical protein
MGRGRSRDKLVRGEWLDAGDYKKAVRAAISRVTTRGLPLFFEKGVIEELDPTIGGDQARLKDLRNVFQRLVDEGQASRLWQGSGLFQLGRSFDKPAPKVMEDIEEKALQFALASGGYFRRQDLLDELGRGADDDHVGASTLDKVLDRRFVRVRTGLYSLPLAERARLPLCGRWVKEEFRAALITVEGSSASAMSLTSVEDYRETVNDLASRMAAELFESVGRQAMTVRLYAGLSLEAIVAKADVARSLERVVLAPPAWAEPELGDLRRNASEPLNRSLYRNFEDGKALPHALLLPDFYYAVAGLLHVEAAALSRGLLARSAVDERAPNHSRR